MFQPYKILCLRQEDYTKSGETIIPFEDHLQMTTTLAWLPWTFLQLIQTLYLQQRKI